MSRKFLADENFPRSVVETLIAMGYDVVTIQACGYRGRPDSEVLQLAQKERRVLITLDRGFGNIFQYPPGTHPGIIVINIHPPIAPRIEPPLLEFLRTRSDISGILVTITEHAIRIRRT